jgi:hypothetical protein
MDQLKKPSLRPGEVPAKFEPGYPVWLHHPDHPSVMVQDQDEHDELLKKDPKKWVHSPSHVHSQKEKHGRELHEVGIPFPARMHHRDYPPVLVFDSEERAKWESKGYIQQGVAVPPAPKAKKAPKEKAAEA